MRRAHGIAAALFALAALLQYNDPDPWRWVVLYAAAAWVAFASARRSAWPLLASAVAGGSLAWMTFLWDSALAFWRRGDWSLLVATMKAGQPLIEESREFLGLALVLAWMLVVLIPRARR